MACYIRWENKQVTKRETKPSDIIARCRCTKTNSRTSTCTAATMFDAVRQQQPYLDALTTPLYDRKAHTNGSRHARGLISGECNHLNHAFCEVEILVIRTTVSFHIPGLPCILCSPRSQCANATLSSPTPSSVKPPKIGCVRGDRIPTTYCATSSTCGLHRLCSLSPTFDSGRRSNIIKGNIKVCSAILHVITSVRPPLLPPGASAFADVHPFVLSCAITEYH